MKLYLVSIDQFIYSNNIVAHPVYIRDYAMSYVYQHEQKWYFPILNLENIFFLLKVFFLLCLLLLLYSLDRNCVILTIIIMQLSLLYLD